MDRVLRRLIGAKIREAMKAEHPDMANVGKMYNKVRTELLADIKDASHEDFAIPESVAKAVENSETDADKVLEDVLDKMVKLKLEK